ELLYNLVDNAIKYNKPGGAVDVSVAGDGARVAARVADTGIGIPEEAQERVFERFYRVDKSRSRKTGGTGLGLAIVKHIAQACGASVSLASKPGEGTSVTVEFAALRPQHGARL
ncbi:MAG: two-component sensor histidine kinase, partial [Clostridiales bacterium]|nr:two-component sensor histidine kinase [Clostridiales bacterium]